MSSLTSEWQLKSSENSIKYIIDIENFDKKIKTFRPGRDIYSKAFMVGRSTFYISIFPGGETANTKDYVGIFLRNNSDWRVRANVSISVQNKSFSKKMDTLFQSKSGFGFPEFAPHGRCNRGDLLTDDGILQLEVNVELLEEEVVQSRDLTQENIFKRFDKLEDTVHENARQIHELKVMIQDLKNSKPPQPSQPKVECPVCMELARPPMRLKQCGQGHTICDTCHSRSKKAAGGFGDATFDPDRCHTCRMVITGRPAALERILGLS